MIRYALFLTREGQSVRLPVNPSELPTVTEAETSRYNVLGIGEVVIPRGARLRSVTIQSFFPAHPFAGITATAPETYIAFLSAALADKAVLTYTPVRVDEQGRPYMVSDAGFDCIVESFTYEERGGETGDFYYTLQLTEYRDYTPGKIILTQPLTAGDPAVITTEPERALPAGALAVGSAVTVSGRYYYTSYGDEPSGAGNGRRAVVSRIVDKERAAPYHINDEGGGALGWCAESAIKEVSG